MREVSWPARSFIIICISSPSPAPGGGVRGGGLGGGTGPLCGPCMPLMPMPMPGCPFIICILAAIIGFTPCSDIAFAPCRLHF